MNRYVMVDINESRNIKRHSMQCHIPYHKKNLPFFKRVPLTPQIMQKFDACKICGGS